MDHSIPSFICAFLPYLADVPAFHTSTFCPPLRVALAPCVATAVPFFLCLPSKRFVDFPSHGTDGANDQIGAIFKRESTVFLSLPFLGVESVQPWHSTRFEKLGSSLKLPFFRVNHWDSSEKLAFVRSIRKTKVSSSTHSAMMPRHHNRVFQIHGEIWDIIVSQERRDMVPALDK
jgi:hypothetical protein